MKKTSRLTRISLLLAVFFGMDKLLGVLRTIIIGRQFGLSQELDVFNAANKPAGLAFCIDLRWGIGDCLYPRLERYALEGRAAGSLAIVFSGGKPRFSGHRGSGDCGRFVGGSP